MSYMAIANSISTRTISSKLFSRYRSFHFDGCLLHKPTSAIDMPDILLPRHHLCCRQFPVFTRS